MQAKNAASVLPEPVGAQIRVFFLARMCGQPSSCGSVGVPNFVTNHSRTSGCAHSRDLRSGASGVAAWFIFRSRNAYSAQKTFSESTKDSTEWHFWRIGWRKAAFRYWRFAGGRVFFAATAFFGLYPGTAAPTVCAHQHPGTLQFFAVERELQVALCKCGVHVGRFGSPGSLVPHHDCATAVFACGDDAFKARVLDRMIFHLHRETLDR